MIIAYLERKLAPLVPPPAPVAVVYYPLLRPNPKPFVIPSGRCERRIPDTPALLSPLAEPQYCRHRFSLSRSTLLRRFLNLWYVALVTRYLYLITAWYGNKKKKKKEKDYAHIPDEEHDYSDWFIFECFMVARMLAILDLHFAYSASSLFGLGCGI